ncbi:MAG TPA: MoaD/ThiS family protein [Streptosporangiaceae bacterium]|nr:MoaD/ThiS family protein [Streptosporangiaceae bacterium]
MAIVTLRYWAAAKDAAGVAEEKVDAGTLAAALAAGLAAARDRPGDAAERLRLVMARSSFLIDGEPAGTRSPGSLSLADDSVIEVLPPFAGG